MPTPRETGVLRMKEGRFSEAAAALSESVAQDPKDVGAWRLLGGALAALEDTPGAVAAFQHTVALDPEQPKNHYNLALSLQAAGDRAGARQHFLHALELNPHYEQARQRLQELEALPSAPPVRAVSPPAYTPAAPPTARVPLPPNYAANNQTYTPPNSLDYGGSFSAASPSYGQGQRQQERPVMTSSTAPQVNGTNVLVLGILGLVLTPILSPFAWYHGKRTLELLDKNPEADQRQRANAQAGLVLGVVGTVLLAMAAILLWLVWMGGGFR
jgi:tetratricopeptide (TPR) repeat protein